MAFSAVLAPTAVSQPSSSATAAAAATTTTTTTGGAAASASHSESLPDDGSSLSSSPPQYPTQLSSPIYEESDEDSECISHNEPVTPVSGRQSSDFQANRIRDQDFQPVIADSSLAPFPSIQPEGTAVPNSKIDLRQGHSARPNSEIVTNTRTDTENPLQANASAADPRASISTRPISPPSTVRTSAEDSQLTPDQERRRSTRGSVSSFKRTMSNLNVFKRSPHTSDGQQPFLVVANHDLTDPNRRWSMNRSSATSPGGNTPPSPASQVFDSGDQNQDSLAPPAEPLSKKNRASTGLALRARAVNFAMGNGRNSKPSSGRRRASSFDAGNDQRRQGNEPDVGPRNVFYAGPETGVGVKARRLSLSLPDEINVEVVELTSEFEYSSKKALSNTPFARMTTKKLGKGATATVRVMARKSFPDELYAVKTFRGKTGSETKEEYDKKVKSEFSLAKSLHHPNVVEAVRLCIDHSRWCHVMEYCSGGDLHTLVKKHKYLKSEDREGDRLCLFKQLIQGLNYLHSNGIAHRDIKLENLLLTKDSKLKITDFGVSEVFTGIHPAARESGGECGRQMGAVRYCKPGICGSQPWMAPEVLAKEKEYDPRKLDVWSAGLVMIALICGGMLWDKADENAPGCQNYAALVKCFDKWNAAHPDGDAPYTETDYPKYKFFDFFIERPPLRRVLLMMLNPDPAKRASIDQIANYRWVKNIECCQPESYDDPSVVIDATDSATFNVKGARKTFCHNHLPPKTPKSHSLGAMPGQAGY